MNAPAGGDKKNIVKMAYIYFQEGRWDKAIEEYKKLIALDPEDINTHNMLGDVYVKKGSTREAFEEYLKVSTDFSSRGQSDKAVIVNKKIASLDASLLPAEAQKKQSLIKQTLKAETAMEQGDVDSAIEALTEVLKLDSENLAAFYKLGELFEKKGQVAEAVKQYQMLGAAFLKNRLYKKSQEMYQKVALLDPSNTEAHSNLAQIFLKQGSESDAKKEYLNAAEQALNAGDLEGANAHAAKAVELKSIEAHYVLGIVFFKRQKLSEAKAEFESLLRFKVNHVGALTHLGRVLLELNQADKAAENIQKALKLEKDNLSAMEAWVELSLKKGNKAEAVTNLGTLIDRYSAKGDYAKASEFARALLSLDENSATAHSKLAEALLKSGNRDAAAEAYFKLALLYEKQDKKDALSDAIRKALELNPNHAEAQKRLLGGAAPGAAATAPHPAAAPTPAPPAAKAPAAGVLDLEQEAAKPFSGPPKAAAATPSPLQPPAPERAAPPAPAAVDPEEDLRAQLSIADNYLKQGMVEEAIEIYQQLSEAYPDNAQVKQKLSQAYTAYVKTGDEVIGALEAEKKAKEEEEKHLRAEMEKKAQEEARRLREELEQKARQEADKKARLELERRAREEAELKAREEMERLTKADAERRQKEELERKSREESLRKAQEEAQRRMREETERKAREEKAAVSPATSRTPPPSKGDSLEEGRDEFTTIAVAEIYVRQGLLEEAAKIYRRITQSEPDNLEARKKLGDVEALIKSKGGSPAAGSGPAKPPEPSAGAAPSPGPAPAPRPPGPEKDSGGKKKSNRVGYV